MGVRDASDQARYSRASIQALIEGTIFLGWSHYITPDGTKGRRKDYRDADDLCWLRLRSFVETTGNVESEGWLAVLDLERAIDKLAGYDAAAAAVVALVRDGFEVWELRGFMRGGEHGVPRLLRKAEAFILAELRGQDGQEAFERAR